VRSKRVSDTYGLACPPPTICFGKIGFELYRPCTTARAVYVHQGSFSYLTNTSDGRFFVKKLAVAEGQETSAGIWNENSKLSAMQGAVSLRSPDSIGSLAGKV